MDGGGIAIGFLIENNIEFLYVSGISPDLSASSMCHMTRGDLLT